MQHSAVSSAFTDFSEKVRKSPYAFEARKQEVNTGCSADRTDKNFYWTVLPADFPKKVIKLANFKRIVSPVSGGPVFLVNFDRNGQTY